MPRYTSYPTALQFSANVDAEVYEDWLAVVPAAASLSLYVHVPFCRELCWFCGCHTKVSRRDAPIERYAAALLREIELVADRLAGHGRVVRHLHIGGGTPTILGPDRLRNLNRHLRERFDVAADSEIAIEIEPRTFGPRDAEAMQDIGVNRASLGVQDDAPAVQAAINRWQPPMLTRQAVDRLRNHGVQRINLDLMYGLPGQTVDGLLKTVDRVLDLHPDRVALFGYAHLPWLKRHQALIAEADLPGPEERLAQSGAATDRLLQAGLVAIGLDHFARKDDALAQAARSGRLRRNFQGYTADNADALIGLGASAIGRPGVGYAQNEADIAKYCRALSQSQLATARGIALRREDRLRGDVIERLMCDLSVDLQAVADRHRVRPEVFLDDLRRLTDLHGDGMVRIDGWRLVVTEAARPLVQIVCSAFDRHLEPAENRHARAV